MKRVLDHLRILRDSLQVKVLENSRLQRLQMMSDGIWKRNQQYQSVGVWGALICLIRDWEPCQVCIIWVNFCWDLPICGWRSRPKRVSMKGWPTGAWHRAMVGNTTRLDACWWSDAATIYALLAFDKLCSVQLAADEKLHWSLPFLLVLF